MPRHLFLRKFHGPENWSLDLSILLKSAHTRDMDEISCEIWSLKTDRCQEESRKKMFQDFFGYTK